MKKSIGLFLLSLILGTSLHAQEDLKPYIAMGVGMHSINATTLNDYYLSGFVSSFSPAWFEDEMNTGQSAGLRVGLRPKKGLGYFFEYGEISSTLYGVNLIAFTDEMGLPLYTVGIDLQLKMKAASSKLGLTYSYPLRDRVHIGVEGAVAYADAELTLSYESTGDGFGLYNESYAFSASNVLYQGALRVDYLLNKSQEFPLSLSLTAGYHHLNADGPTDSNGEEWLIHYPDNVPKRVDIQMSGIYSQLMLTVGI